MRYFKDASGEVFGFDQSQENLIQEAISRDFEEVTEIWPPKQTQKQIIDGYIFHIQKRLDDFARTRGYDGVLSCCTYATSTVAKFKAEGQYMVDARDQTWSAGYQILADVESGARPVPTLEELDAELPALAWPA